MSFSRRRTREFLLQLLYARTQSGESFRRDLFISSYFESSEMASLDMAYLDVMEDIIIASEPRLLATIASLASKFDLATIPVMHILILEIAMTEMSLFTMDTIPEKVSINEAIELAKRFSDDSWRMFVNGTLSSFLKNKKTIENTPMDRTFFTR